MYYELMKINSISILSSSPIKRNSQIPRFGDYADVSVCFLALDMFHRVKVSLVQTLVIYSDVLVMLMFTCVKR